MVDIKQFLDFPGLEEYDRLIKNYIKTGSTDEIDKIIGELAVLAAENQVRDLAIQSNADAIEVLNADRTVEGSVDKKISDAISELVNGAPEALDTLKEIADWIEEDETGTIALISRVTENEEKIEQLQESDIEIKEYVDTQDKQYFDAIQSIDELKIKSLFPIKQDENVSATEAIIAIGEGDAIQLKADQIINENLVIDKSCYIDANGSTFTGTVTIPADAEVIIENATFTTPVVIA